MEIEKGIVEQLKGREPGLENHMDLSLKRLGRTCTVRF